MPNVICMHEEDYGILWKHQDMHSGRTEVRRSRRLVISSIATVGNYEYGFYWYLYLDGTVQLEVKLTGIMSTAALSDDEPVPPHARRIAPGLAAPVHQHLFCARLDMAVDGGLNEVWEMEVDLDAAGRRQPVGQRDGGASRPGSRPSSPPGVAPTRPRNRTWRIVNPGSRNRLGEPVGYKLFAGATPTLLAHPDSSIGRRAGFATREPLGHALRPRAAAPRRRLPQPARRARRVGDLDRGGPIASWAPTSWCGTPSGSPTSRGPRTGRSCPSSTPGST